MSANTQPDADSTDLPTAIAACIAADRGDRLRVTTDRLEDTFEVVATWREGDSRVLALDRDGLGDDGYDITVRYGQFWLTAAPATAPTLTVADDAGDTTTYAVEDASVTPTRNGGDA